MFDEIEVAKASLIVAGALCIGVVVAIAAIKWIKAVLKQAGGTL